jgi:hypothetical protein
MQDSALSGNSGRGGEERKQSRPNNLLQQTGHAYDGSFCFRASSRVGRRLSVAFGQRR